MSWQEAESILEQAREVYLAECRRIEEACVRSIATAWQTWHAAHGPALEHALEQAAKGISAADESLRRHLESIRQPRQSG